MILFFAPGGRLGNLFFQLAFLQSLRNNKERLVATQLKQAPIFLTGMRRCINSNNKVFINIIDYIIAPFVKKVLVRSGLLGSFVERDGEISSQEGLLPIRYVEGYFQKSCYLENKSGTLSLHPNTQKLAHTILGRTESRRPLFIHIRRTDYKGFSPVGGESAQLPAGYYHRALRTQFSDWEGYHFFVVGDDPDWAEKEFHYLPFKTISRESPQFDLGLMSLCEGGIISNSTFAWWGAFWCRRTAPILAPRHWLGWRMGRTWPVGIEAPWMTLIDVLGGP